uniref:D-aminoacyl-tRNA deacylase n=1 Tax=Saccoglossus kowalevskii TaxID=10224 RepID=A0ABM0MQ55_SACKO|nr:PREDICTED: probable D-tyrosyl-tRNA(Tyr) deacylase 2-like [Saccoglossus kowalevskii]
MDTLQLSPIPGSDLIESKARIVIQQCVSARVQLQSPVEGGSVDFVEIKKGIVVYVCFLKECSKELLNRMAHVVLHVRYLKDAHGSRVSVLELPGDVLIVPQSTLGGIRKKRHLTYHYNVNKEDAHEMYKEFVSLCRRGVEENVRHQCQVRCGQYNSKQEGMLVESGECGLMTHLVEF